MVEVHKAEDVVVMEVVICKGEKVFEVVQWMPVPFRDGGVENNWHGQVFWDIYKNHINP